MSARIADRAGGIETADVVNCVAHRWLGDERLSKELTMADEGLYD